MSEFDQQPFGDATFVNNPQARCPCILLLDVSGSMSGAPIEQLNQGLQLLQEEIQADSLAAKRVEFAIVTFGPVRTEMDFTSAGTVSFTKGEKVGTQPIVTDPAKVLVRLGLVGNRHPPSFEERDLIADRKVRLIVQHKKKADPCNAEGPAVSREEMGEPPLRVKEPGTPQGEKVWLSARKSTKSSYSATDYDLIVTALWSDSSLIAFRFLAVGAVAVTFQLLLFLLLFRPRLAAFDKAIRIAATIPSALDAVLLRPLVARFVPRTVDGSGISEKGLRNSACWKNKDRRCCAEKDQTRHISGSDKGRSLFRCGIRCGPALRHEQRRERRSRWRQGPQARRRRIGSSSISRAPRRN